MHRFHVAYLLVHDLRVVESQGGTIYWCFDTEKIPDLSVTMFSHSGQHMLYHTTNCVQYNVAHEPSWIIHGMMNLFSRFLRAVAKKNANLEAMFCHQKTLHQKMCSAMGSSLAVFESSSKNPGPNGGPPGADGAKVLTWRESKQTVVPRPSSIPSYTFVFSYLCFLMTRVDLLEGSPRRIRGTFAPKDSQFCPWKRVYQNSSTG